MGPGQLLQLVVVLVKLPLHLMFLALLNVANFIAPGLVFTVVKKVLSGSHVGKSITAESTAEMAFMFSLDRVWVSGE